MSFRTLSNKLLDNSLITLSTKIDTPLVVVAYRRLGNTIMQSVAVVSIVWSQSCRSVMVVFADFGTIMTYIAIA